MEKFDPEFLPRSLWESLKTSLQKGRFPHALLITGPDGVGKMNMAIAVSAGLLCSENKGPENCGCSSCRRIQEGNHPDFRLIEDEGEATLKVDQIREAIVWAALRPFEGKNKVMVLESVERLSEEALNAFLKLLEEPPRSTFLILLTDQPARLKQTLLSRCFQIAVKPADAAGIHKRLAKKGIDEDEVHYVSFISGGINKKAEELLEEGAFEEDSSKLELLLSRYSYELADEFLGTSSGRSKPEVKRELVADFLRIAQTFLRDVLLWKTMGDEADSSLFFKHRIHWVRKKAGTETESSLSAKLAQLEDVRRSLERYGNPKLTLMTLSEIMGEPLIGAGNV